LGKDDDMPNDPIEPTLDAHDAHNCEEASLVVIITGQGIAGGGPDPYEPTAVIRWCFCPVCGQILKILERIEKGVVSGDAVVLKPGQTHEPDGKRLGIAYTFTPQEYGSMLDMAKLMCTRPEFAGWRGPC